MLLPIYEYHWWSAVLLVTIYNQNLREWRAEWLVVWASATWNLFVGLYFYWSIFFIGSYLFFFIGPYLIGPYFIGPPELGVGLAQRRVLHCVVVVPCSVLRVTITIMQNLGRKLGDQNADNNMWAWQRIFFRDLTEVEKNLTILVTVLWLPFPEVSMSFLLLKCLFFDQAGTYLDFSSCVQHNFS